MNPYLSAIAFLNEKANTFIDFQLWPVERKFNIEGWLKNFEDDELRYAYQLLNNFVYLSEDLANRVFLNAIHKISSQIISAEDSYQISKRKWNNFLNTAYFTHITGENPNPSDSGPGFTRKARQIMKIEEEQIISPEHLIELLYQNPHTQFPIVFVDDFVGSGEQCDKTWHRKYNLSEGQKSFSDYYAENPQSTFFYCPLIATERGAARIKDDCKGLKLCAAHILDESYSAVSENSRIWDSETEAGGKEFLKKASQRAGIPDDESQDDWRGFKKCGLSLAIGDSVPDATLPIYYWDKNGWIPLVKRN